MQTNGSSQKASKPTTGGLPQNGLAGGLAAGLIPMLLSGIGGNDQYVNTNPYTADALSTLTGLTNSGQSPVASAFFGPGGGMSDIYNSLMAPTSQFYKGQTDLARRSAQTGIDQAANQMAGLGGLYSGATLDAGNRAAQDAYLQATNNTNQLLSQLAGAMGGQALNGEYGSYNTALDRLGSYGDPTLEAPYNFGSFMGDLGQTALSVLPFLL